MMMTTTVMIKITVRIIIITIITIIIIIIIIIFSIDISIEPVENLHRSSASARGTHKLFTSAFQVFICKLWSGVATHVRSCVTASRRRDQIEEIWERRHVRQHVV